MALFRGGLNIFFGLTINTYGIRMRLMGTPRVYLAFPALGFTTANPACLIGQHVQMWHVPSHRLRQLGRFPLVVSRRLPWDFSIARVVYWRVQVHRCLMPYPLRRKRINLLAYR